MKRIKMSANILFSGVGFQERGIRNTGLYELEVKNTSEIKKEAILAYAGIHCGLTPEMIKTYREYPTLDSMIEELKEKNIGFIPPADNENAGIPFYWEKYRKKPEYIKKYWLAVKLSHCQGDISRIKELSYADLWTVSFPCQSISVAGKMKGFNPDSGTRSSLLWENIRLLKNACDKGEAPKYILFENVKNLAKKFLKDFEALMDVLDDLGFNSYWDILNGKDCGIPHNRERVFVVCIRKDLDDGTYHFPKSFDSGLRLQDVLCKDVDEKYYLCDEKAQPFIDQLILDGKIEPEV